MRVNTTTRIARPPEDVFDMLPEAFGGYDRPSRLVFEASGKPDLTIACTLTPTGEGTELESDFDFRPRGALKVLFPLLAPVIRRDVPKQYASFKALCER